MDLYQEVNNGYIIINSITCEKSAVVLAYNEKAPAPYVTWITKSNRSRGYDLGHYFTKYKDAFKDFKDRCYEMMNDQLIKESHKTKPKEQKNYER